MKCPYRIYKTEYPHPMKKETICTSEEFGDCYGKDCAYWDSLNIRCGKAYADMTVKEDK